MWLRVKREDMQLDLIDSTTIRAFAIDEDKDELGNGLGSYQLCVMTEQAYVSIMPGSASECRKKLEELLELMKISYVDV